MKLWTTPTFVSLHHQESKLLIVLRKKRLIASVPTVPIIKDQSRVTGSASLVSGNAAVSTTSMITGEKQWVSYNCCSNNGTIPNMFIQISSKHTDACFCIFAFAIPVQTTAFFCFYNFDPEYFQRKVDMDAPSLMTPYSPCTLKVSLPCQPPLPWVL